VIQRFLYAAFEYAYVS